VFQQFSTIKFFGPGAPVVYHHVDNSYCCIQLSFKIAITKEKKQQILIDEEIRQNLNRGNYNIKLLTLSLLLFSLARIIEGSGTGVVS
jgi:hypothetical protein